MTQGKNQKKLSGKKLSRKNARDPFLRKEWYWLTVPNAFKERNAGKTCVTKTTGMKTASDALKGRVFETSLADLTGDEMQCYRKMQFRVEDVQGRRCLTNFHGMDLTTDRLKSLVRKWQSLIEAHVDVKTIDGFYLRIFCIGFTAKRKGRAPTPGHPQTSYAQAAQVRRIRKRMAEIMTREATTSDLKSLVSKFVAESIAKQIQRNCERILPLDNVYIRKVKMLKTPKFDANKLQELHGDLADEDLGLAIPSTTAEAPAPAPAEAPAPAPAPAPVESK